MQKGVKIACLETQTGVSYATLRRHYGKWMPVEGQSELLRFEDATKPFFAYATLTQPHLPTLPNPGFAGKTRNGDWADMLAEMDHNVGRCLMWWTGWASATTRS